MTGEQCYTYQMIIKQLASAAEGLRRLQSDIHGCFGNLATAVEETSQGVRDVWETIETEELLKRVHGHLRRLNADGGDGIAATAVPGYPQDVLLFDTQEETVYDIQEVQECLRTLSDGAGFEATWMALGTLQERRRT